MAIVTEDDALGWDNPRDRPRRADLAVRPPGHAGRRVGEASMVVVPDVIGGELPVAANGPLLDPADDPRVALSDHLVDADRRDVTEVILQRRRAHVECGEDEAAVGIDLRRLDQAP